MKFSHIGLITDKKRDNERLVATTGVWVTDFDKHPYRVEWLRFEKNSPVKGSVREESHIAFEVDNLEEASKGLRVLLEPFRSSSNVKIGFYEYADGTIIELMEYPKNN